MDASVDYYATLGVLPSAEDVVIRAAYRALSLRYHPDQWRGDHSVGEEYMRQLNAAYEVLSDPVQRRRYDQARMYGYQQYQNDESTAGAAFTSQEWAQADAWKIALEYFPDLDAILKRLQTTSTRLAVSFRATLLETKQFKNRAALADQLEKRFLQSYFGNSEILTEFARELITGGDREAAKELNRVVSVLGDGDAAAIVARIKSKYAPRTERAILEALAKRILEFRYVDDAEILIRKLGGDIKVRDLSFLPFGSSKLYVNCLHFSVELNGHDKMVDWVVAYIVPRVLQRLH